jgi:hypothetical protein
VLDTFTTSQPAGSKQAFAKSHGSTDRVPSDWLRLAATPTFALMALLSALGGGQHDMLCAAMQNASPLSGMMPMYLLMSAFHSAPWVRLLCGRKTSAI